MSRKKNIPVRDSSARKILFHETRRGAMEMVERGAAFILANDPLELALVSRARRTAIEIQQLRPDQSLTVTPTVVHGAALGFVRPSRIIESYLPNSLGEKEIPNTVKAPKTKRFA